MGVGCRGTAVHSKDVIVHRNTKGETKDETKNKDYIGNLGLDIGCGDIAVCCCGRWIACTVFVGI